MNVLLWVLQVVLALFYLAGGQYKVFHFTELAKVPPGGALSRGQWGALGVFEMLCAVLLVVPAAAKWMPVLTLLAAAALALESLALAVWFARYSLALRATNPLVYVVVGGADSGVRGLRAVRAEAAALTARRRAVSPRRPRCSGSGTAVMRCGAV